MTEKPISYGQIVEQDAAQRIKQDFAEIIPVLHQIRDGFEGILNETKKVAKENPFASAQDAAKIATDLNNAKEASEGLAKANADLSKATASYVRNLEEEEKLLKDIKGEINANIAQSVDYRKRLKEITQEQKDLELALKRGQLTQEKYKKDTNALAKEQNELKIAASALNQTISAQTKENIAAIGSMDEIGQRLGRLKSSYRALSAEERNNTKIGGQLINSINILDKEIKELDANIGNHQRNVGNYGNALSGLPGAFGNAASGAQQLGQSLLALLKNPVALVIAAIVAALYALFKAFTKTDEGGTKFAAVMEQVSAVIDVLMGRLGLLANGIVNVFQGNWKEASEQFSQAFADISDQLKNATDAAKEYIFALDELEDAEIGYISQRAKNANDIAKLEFLAADRSQPIEARRNALKLAISLGEEELKKEQDFANKRYQIEIKKQAALKGVSEIALQNFIEANDEQQKYLLENDVDIRKARNLLNDEGQKELEEYYTTALNLETKFFEENKRNIGRLSGFNEQVAADSKAKLEKQKQAEDEINKQYFELAIQRITDTETKELEILDASYEERLQKAKNNTTLRKMLLEQLRTDRLAIIKKYDDAEFKQQQSEARKIFDEELRDTKLREQILLDNAEKELILNKDKFKNEVEFEKAKNKALKEIKIKFLEEELERIKNQTGIEFEAQRAALELQLAQLKLDLKDNDAEAQKAFKEQISNIQKLANEANKLLEQNSQRRLRLLDKEFEASKKRQEDLKNLAIQGNKDAQASIAAEDKRQAEIELKREREAKKAKLRELGLTAINTYNSKVQAGDKNALGSTIRDLSLLSAAVSALLPGFYEGTENVADSLGKPNFAGRDGYVVKVDGSERVMTGQQNKMIGGVSNEDVAKVMSMYNSGMLIHASQIPVFGVPTSTNDISEIKDEIKNMSKELRDLPHNMPKSSMAWDVINKIVEEKITTKNKTTTTRTKIGGSWNRN